jgi:hypothetical protein
VILSAGNAGGVKQKAAYGLLFDKRECLLDAGKYNGYRYGGAGR